MCVNESIHIPLHIYESLKQCVEVGFVVVVAVVHFFPTVQDLRIKLSNQPYHQGVLCTKPSLLSSDELLSNSHHPFK